MKFLKLTLNTGAEAWLNVAAIGAIHLDAHGTKVLLRGDSEPFNVTETPEQIAAMLAEPAACEPDCIVEPAVTDGWTATISGLGPSDVTIPLPRLGQAVVALDPLDGACVRVLPTPTGQGRFLCLPEVDRMQPARGGKYLACFHSGDMEYEYPMDAGEPWQIPVNAGVTAAYGPLPEKAP